ncbi:MAG: hypothetical protein EXR78_02330 [Deltaproteobacteria bacterium]|nr:hypothetical protein [Deltaproteobacteria bacterium]
MAQASKSSKAKNGAKKSLPIVGVNLTASSHEYLIHLYDLGLFEGSLGATKVHAELTPVVDALHHVLTGGKVELRVVQSGNADLKKRLDGQLAQSLKDTNQVNRQVRYPLTVAV